MNKKKLALLAMILTMVLPVIGAVWGVVELSNEIGSNKATYQTDDLKNPINVFNPELKKEK